MVYFESHAYELNNNQHKIGCRQHAFEMINSQKGFVRINPPFHTLPSTCTGATSANLNSSRNIEIHLSVGASLDRETVVSGRWHTKSNREGGGLNTSSIKIWYFHLEDTRPISSKHSGEVGDGTGDSQLYLLETDGSSKFVSHDICKGKRIRQYHKRVIFSSSVSLAGRVFSLVHFHPKSNWIQHLEGHLRRINSQMRFHSLRPLPRFSELPKIENLGVKYELQLLAPIV